MQIYGLNGIGQVADIPGAVAGGQKFKMQKDAIDEQKKLENTTWLAGAAKYGLDNWGQPGILEQLVEEGKRRGIIDPQTQPQGITKDGLIKIYQGARTALGGVDEKALQPQHKDPAGVYPTTQQRNFEQRQRIIEQYGPNSPELKFFEESVRAGRPVEIGGVPHWKAPGQDPYALSSLDREADAQRTIRGAGKSGEVEQGGQASRYQDSINRGIELADATVIVRRGLELLDRVKTGRPEEVALWAKNMFGIAGADETELSANLGKAVLSQLRETFGAQFTENEGKRLEYIEANFGKSTEGNRRLLEQALKIAERAAQRGLAAARQTGDQWAIDEIEKSLNYNLGDDFAGGPQNNGGGAGQQQDLSGYIQIQNDAQFDRLPSGTMFVGPDGKLRTKP